MKEKENQIDIVFPWVDGSDPVWQERKRQYSDHSAGDDEVRFRDWGLLKYVFRGIEQNLPWIRKVHFITCGHLPEWLNTDCPKLHVIKHSDYIPEKWLPTFSSHPIELNIHRIPDLSEQFIYMNDDTFFVKPMKPEGFFVHGKPVSQAGLEIISETDRQFTGILYSDLEVINRCFFSRWEFPKTFSKFVNLQYGFKENYKTMRIAPWCVGYYPGFPYIHGPNAYLKSTFEEVWSKETAVLEETSSHKFRTYTDVNQYLMLWWQWCKGDFVPKNVKKSLMFLGVDKDAAFLRENIQNPLTPMLCVNDVPIHDFEEKKECVTAAFERVLGNKSKFEL